MYWRRRLAPARVLMVLTVCVTLLFMLLPMALMPWNSTFAIQPAFGPGAGRGYDAHFPAQSARLLSRRAPRRARRPTRRSSPALARSGLQLWDDEELRDVGPDSVAFLTGIEPRGLPLDWRVKLNYVQADYSAGGATLYSLRPANYITDHVGGGSLAHAWMLPESAVQQLRGVQPKLTLTYSLTLLKPREYRVPRTGSGTRCPDSVTAAPMVDEPGNRIDVDCFSASTHSAQISAQLNEISASRVYSSRGLRAALTRMAVQPARGARHRLAASREARQHHGHRVGRGGLLSRSR